MVLVLRHVADWITQRVDKTLFTMDDETLRQIVVFLACAGRLLESGFVGLDARCLIHTVRSKVATGVTELVRVHLHVSAVFEVLAMVLVLLIQH